MFEPPSSRYSKTASTSHPSKGTRCHRRGPACWHNGQLLKPRDVLRGSSTAALLGLGTEEVTPRTHLVALCSRITSCPSIQRASQSLLEAGSNPHGSVWNSRPRLLTELRWVPRWPALKKARRLHSTLLFSIYTDVSVWKY